eukprot:5725122-Prymnesium_polylepis.1
MACARPISGCWGGYRSRSKSRVRRAAEPNQHQQRGRAALKSHAAVRALHSHRGRLHSHALHSHAAVRPAPAPRPLALAPASRPLALAPAPRPFALAPSSRPLALAPASRPLALAPASRPVCSRSRL